MLLNLPNELLGLVAEQLKRDTLLSLSLVHTSLRHISQKAAFRDAKFVIYEVPEDSSLYPESPLHPAITKNNITLERLRALSAALDSSPRLRNYLQHIKIVLRLDTDPSGATHFPVGKLPGLLNRLSSLRYFCLHAKQGRVGWTKLPVSLTGAIARVCDATSSRFLEFCGIDALPESLFLHCSELSWLELQRFCIDLATNQNLTSGETNAGHSMCSVLSRKDRRRPKLFHLGLADIVENPAFSIHRWITEGFDLSGLRELEIEGVGDSTNYVEVQMLLDHSAESLHSVGFMPEMDKIDAEAETCSLIRCLNFAKLVQLESVLLSGYCSHAQNSSLPWIIDAFDSVTSKSIHEIGVVIVTIPPAAGPLSHGPWADLDRVLTKPEFCNVKTVEIYLPVIELPGISLSDVKRLSKEVVVHVQDSLKLLKKVDGLQVHVYSGPAESFEEDLEKFRAENHN